MLVESGDEWHGFHMTEGVSMRMVGDGQGIVVFGSRGEATTTGGVEDGETNG